MSTNNRVVADIWLDCFLNLDMGDDTNTKFLLLRVQTAYIYDLGNERWLFGDIIDHVRIYGSRVAEGLSASNVGLVSLWAYYEHVLFSDYWVKYLLFEINMLF